MFRRLHIEEWQSTLNTLGFVIFFVLFVGVVVYVWRMSKTQRTRLKNLPLEEEHHAPK
jgi:cbb3-type cytochrome oxidase subunit 3